MGGLVDSVLGFVGAHREWSVVLAFLFAAAETTALLSIIVPSTAILVGVGALVSTGALDFLPIWAGAALGAVAGSTLSWWLGVAFGDRILGLWPLRNYPEQVVQGTAAFKRWGLWAVLIGHFFGPLRSVAFLMAGMARIGFWRFQLVNVPGALMWAFVVPKMGELGGDVASWLWGQFGL